MNIMVPVEKAITISFDLEFKEIDAVKQMMDERYGSVYNLKSHVTLLLLPIMDEYYQAAFEAYDEFLAGLKSFEIEFGNVLFSEDRNIFKLEILGPKLFELESSLLKMSEKFRHDAVRLKDIRRVDEGFYSQEKVEHIKKFGYLFCEKYFKPHTSLGNIPTGEFNVNEVMAELNETLKPVLGKKLEVDHIEFVYHTDNDKQSEMNTIFKKRYGLM